MRLWGMKPLAVYGLALNHLILGNDVLAVSSGFFAMSGCLNAQARQSYGSRNPGKLA